MLSINHINKFLINILLPSLIIGGLGFFLYNNKEHFLQLFDLSLLHLGLLVLLILSTWVVNSLQTHVILKSYGFGIKYSETIVSMVAMMLGNYLPGKFGTLLRMQYFKKVHGLDYSKFGGMMAARILVLAIHIGFLGMVGAIGLGVFENKKNLLLFGTFSSILIFFLTLYMLPEFKVRVSNSRVNNILGTFLDGFNVIKIRRTLFFQLLLLIFFQFMILSMRLSIVFEVMGVDIPIWSLLMMGPISTLISFINVTPGNLGVREWSLGVLSVATGVDFKIGIFACTIDTVVLILCTFIFGSFSLIYTYNKVKN